MKSHNNLLIPNLIDAVISTRQSIKTFLQPRIKEIYGNDISYEMFQVLNVLWRKGEQNQQDIANAVQKGKASLTPLIDNLVKNGLVVRTEDISDRRNKIISLTEKGEFYKHEFEPLLQDFYERFKADRPDEKIKELTLLLLLINNNL
jgi:DNA-binding MarR family transcriptional regulator